MNFNCVSTLRTYKMPKPGVPCIYILKDHCGIVFYIGQTKSIRSRLKNHKKEKNDFAYFCIEELSGITLNNREAALIAKYKPRENKTMPTNDFYFRKSSLKKQITAKIDLFIRELDDDFCIGDNALVKYINTYKGLIIIDTIDEAIKTARDTINLLNKGEK